MSNSGADISKKRLLLFGINRLDDMLKKGNVWYVRHYEEYFDEVYVLYLYGQKYLSRKQGRTHLISLGSGGSLIKDLLRAPFVLYQAAKKIQPTSYLTADIFFGWWTTIMIRLIGRAKCQFTPVCIPEEIYRSTGASITGLPIWLERLFIHFSFTSADTVSMTRNGKASLAWLRHHPAARNKLLIVDLQPEELPPPEFYEALNAYGMAQREKPATPTLLYVGRLHREKHVADLIDMMAKLKQMQISVQLLLAGSGPERTSLEERAKSADVAEQIVFCGTVVGADLVKLYHNASIFVSTVTGTALREAGLCGVAVVAYNIDWVPGLLVNGETALLVPRGDTSALAHQVARLVSDERLREAIATNFGVLARSMWGLTSLASGLRQSFPEMDCR